MATKNFTQFDLETTPLSGDYLVGYKEDGSAEFRTTVRDILEEGGYQVVPGTNSIKPISDDNIIDSNNSNIGGGTNNHILSSGDFSVIAGGSGNSASGAYSAILGGRDNSDAGYTNTFILGSSLSATRANTTFVNAIVSPVYYGSKGYDTSSYCYGSIGGNGGYIAVNGGNVDRGTSSGGAGSGGNINLNGGNASDGQQDAGNGGSISLQGGSSGSVSYLNAGGSAGSIISNGGLTQYGNTVNGGTLNMSGGIETSGGSINTSEGGGSIDTRGQGSIQLGTASAYTMTQLQGSASGSNKTITLPNASGTLALKSDLNNIPSLSSYSLSAQNLLLGKKVIEGGLLTNDAYAYMEAVEFGNTSLFLYSSNYSSIKLDAEGSGYSSLTFTNNASLPFSITNLWNNDWPTYGGTVFETNGSPLVINSSTISVNITGRVAVNTLVLANLNGDPADPVEGQIYYNSGTKHFYGWNGSAWKQLDN